MAAKGIWQYIMDRKITITASHPQFFECKGGLGFSTQYVRLQRMKAITDSVLRHMLDLGDSTYRSVCFKSFTSTAMLYGLGTGPNQQQGQGTFSGKVETPFCICIPSILCDRQGSQESADRHVSTQSVNFPKKNRPTEKPTKKCHPFLKSNSLRLSAWNISGRIWKQKKYQKEGLLTLSLLPEDQELPALTTRLGENDITAVLGCPLRCSVEYILDFLAGLFEQGLEYSTIG